MLLLFPVAAGFLTQSPGPPVEGADRAAARLKAYQTLQAGNQKKLGTYAVADASKGTFQIPIERAMDLIIPELNQHPPAPAGPIATPSPAPATPSPGGSP